MNKKLPWIIGGIAVVAGLMLFAIFSSQKSSNEAALGHGGPLESLNYTLFATSTLSASYTGAGAVSSSVILVEGVPNIVIGGVYVPRSAGSKLYILVERSLDKGLTWVPYSTITPESNDVLVNTAGTSTTNGSPFVIGNGAVTASGTAIGYSFDVSLAADYVRVSAKESTTSTAGLVNAKIIATSN